MAKMTAAQLDEGREKFEEKQLDGLDSLYAANPDSVNFNVITDLITEEVKDAIEEAIPEHEHLFRRAMEAEKKRGASQKEAFRTAFEAVYGRVLFEHGRLKGDEVQKALTARLGKVLKTPIETSSDPTMNPLAGRPELQAATERLRRFQMNGGKTDELLDKAFAGVKAEGEKVTVHGFETQFGHAANRLKEVREYFESPVQIDLVRRHYSDLNTLVGKANVDEFKKLMGEVGLNPADPIKGNIKKLDARIQSKRRLVIQDQKNATLEQREKNEEARDEQAGKIAKLDELLETLKDIFEQSKKLYEEMKALARNLEVVEQTNAHIKDTNAIVNIDGFLNKFEAIDLRSSDFSPASLVECYATVEPFLSKDTAVSDVARALAKAEKTVTSSTNLTDEQAAKKIVAALVGEQFPDMSVEDRAKMATMILTEDVMRLQQAGSYESIAREGSAELLKTVNHAGVKAQLIGFRYKVGEKTEQPFKGLKPSDFEDWAKILKLFEIGRLNHKNGFFVMAALEAFEKDAHTDIRSVQFLQIEKKLKALLAEKMGVKDKMGDSRVAKIVCEAFDEQMEMVRPLVKAYLEHYDLNSAKWDENKIKELNVKMLRLREEFKLGKIPQDTFERRKAKLLQAAEEAGVEDRVEFSEDSVMTDWWESPDSAWLRDAGSNTAEWGKAKAKGIGKGALGVAWAGVVGTTKLGLNVGLQTALLPLRLVKYPLLIAAKPLVGIINLFRRSKWIPLPGIRNSIRNDFSRTLGYVKGTTVNTVKGAYNTVTTVPKAEWGKAKGKEKPYKDRTKVNVDHLAEEAKEYGEKAMATPIETSTSPFIELNPWIEKIKALGIEAKFGSEIHDKKAA